MSSVVACAGAERGGFDRVRSGAGGSRLRWLGRRRGRAERSDNQCAADFDDGHVRVRHRDRRHDLRRGTDAAGQAMAEGRGHVPDRLRERRERAGQGQGRRGRRDVPERQQHFRHPAGEALPPADAQGEQDDLVKRVKQLGGDLETAKTAFEQTNTAALQSANTQIKSDTQALIQSAAALGQAVRSGN